MSNKKLFLVDWEIAHVSHPVMELLFFFEQSPMSKKQQSLVLEKYLNYNPDVQFFKLKPIILKFMRFEDLAWAARRLAYAKKDDNNRIGHFEKLVEKRIELLERSWKS